MFRVIICLLEDKGIFFILYFR